MIVADASAVVLAVTEPEGAATLAMLANEETHAPSLIDVEIASALRRSLLRGALDHDRAVAMIGSAAGLIDHRHEPLDLVVLSARWWQHVSAYDAIYVALATTLRCPLLTADARLPRTHSLGCDVILAP